MSVSGIRNNQKRYFEYNTYRQNFYGKSLSKVQRNRFRLIPLLFHFNENKLPGYVGKKTPCGIKLYKAAEDVIRLASKVNNEIETEEFEEPVNPEIEAVYLQEHFKTGDSTLWVICEKGLRDEEFELLNRKCKKIEKWLLKAGLSICVSLTTRGSISNDFYDRFNSGFHIDKSIFFEDFYTETILLAGKAPLWWLIEDEENITYGEVKASNLYDDCIDFESFNALRINDYYSAAIWYLLNIDCSAVTTWLELSLLLYRVTNVVQHEPYSKKLKIVVQAGYFNGFDANPRRLYASFINNVINEVINDKVVLINNLFIQVISHYYHSRRKNNNTQKSIYDFIYEIRASATGGIINTNPGVEEYMSSLESMYKLAEDIFERFKAEISHIDDFKLDKIKELDPTTDRLLNKLKHSSKNIHILSNPKAGYFTQEKVIISYRDKAKPSWVLSFPISEKETNDIKDFDSVVELLVWSYVNQIIDTGTQVLADCSSNIITSLDIVNTIRLIADNVDLKDLSASDLNAFVSRALPIKSLLFVDQLSQVDGGQNAYVNQLIIYNNGEFHTHQYSGYEQFIACVYNWYNLINHTDLVNKPTIKMFAIKPGESQELKSNMTGLMHELGQYFDSNPISNTRTILKNDDKYYVSHITDSTVLTSVFNDMESLYKYLEKPLDKFTACIFTETFEQDAMLSYLLTQNMKNVMQLFYYIEGKTIRVFVFDQNGALFTYKQELIHRQSFVNQWMMFLNNMRKKYNNNFPVEFNQLIKLDDITYEHVPLTGEMLPSDNKCFSLDLKVTNVNDSYEVSFACDDRVFSSREQGEGIYSEISRYIGKKLELSENMPVYISDVDVPEELLAYSTGRDACLIDYLKYKRNIEKRLIDRINSHSDRLEVD